MTNKLQTIKNEEVILEKKTLFSKITSWIKSNPVEFYILMTLVPAFIMGFSMATHATGVKGLFDSLHTMHTSHINISIGYFGFGAAIFNASGIALLYYAYGKATKVEWTASPFMSIMLVFGFSFYILNFYAILFIIVGIIASSMIFKTTLDKSYGAATLSTCLTPIFAFLAFSESTTVPQYGGILLGGLIMILTAIMAQKIGGLVAKVNDGLTLANTGVSHGFLAIFFYTLLIISGASLGPVGNDALTEILKPGYVEGSVADFLPYADRQWYLMVFMATVTTTVLAIFWNLFPKDKGIMEVITKDGKAPTDWFVVAGIREAAFNIWAFVMLGITLTGIWAGVSGAEFAMSSNVSVSFIQAFAFAAFGQNLLGALILTVGFYVAWFFTLSAGPNGGGAFGDIWNSPWDKNAFMSLVMFGWLLTPMIGVNIFAPFIAAIFHPAWHRMFGVFSGGFTYYTHGISTFMSVVVLLPFFQGINWLRKPKGALLSDVSVSESIEKLERNKVVAMSSELLFYLSDEGATDLITKFKFGKASSSITVEMSKGKTKVLEALSAELNEFKRDSVIEYNMWSTLGTDSATRNLALLAQMTDTAKLTKSGKTHTLVLTRKIVEADQAK